MKEQPDRTIPRWAAELGEETWLDINEKLYTGWECTDLVRELNLPENKLRSLQLYASRFGPRRRLRMFAKFKDSLVSGGAELGPQFMLAMKAVAEQAISSKVKPARQQRACDLMIKFTDKLTRLMESDEVTEQAREETETVKPVIDREDVIRQMAEIYGLKITQRRKGAEGNPS